MRSITRFSIDGEVNSQLRNLLAGILTTSGYVLNPNVTATYEPGRGPRRALGVSSVTEATRWGFLIDARQVARELAKLEGVDRSANRVWSPAPDAAWRDSSLCAALVP